METLTTDELGCGLRCLRNEKCLSYNSHTDGACQLSNNRRQSSPDSLRRRAASTYYGKGRIVRSKSYMYVRDFLTSFRETESLGEILRGYRTGYVCQNLQRYRRYYEHASTPSP